MTARLLGLAGVAVGLLLGFAFVIATSHADRAAGQPTGFAGRPRALGLAAAAVTAASLLLLAGSVAAG